ncbi:type II CRISPR-associated endonuclease Cas1 [Parasphingorhabdus sp. DH2-15]|uniref:type II CRISPR-associated endonuclease Cas1 n=1 Tax=Parasphingorhabdus sp. DH2-15 TaxID=3444112 RepID=UPI003F6872EB
MDRIVDIETDKLHLCVIRGFMAIKLDHEEIGRIALDDIAAVIVHAHGVSWTTNLIVQLAQRGAMMVLCAANHAPVAMMVPVEGHHSQNARFRAQWDAPRPMMKRAWKDIVSAKVHMQGSLLTAIGKEEGEGVSRMAKRIRSGDPENIEAQAARRYWPALFGSDFRRDRTVTGTNAMLNYGYTVMRAMVARSIIAAGLHPTIGLHHANRLNAFALADDLVEPFRPLVDAAVHQMVQEGVSEVNKMAKARLAALISADLNLEGATSPMSICAQHLAQTLAASFEHGQLKLALFSTPDPLSWSAIARHIPQGEAR